MSQLPENSPLKAPRFGFHRRRVCLAGFFVVAAVLGYFVVLPWIAHRVILGKLHDAGINTATFSLHRVSPFGLVMGNVAIGEPRTVRADAIDVSFTPRSLWHGKLTEVAVRGASVTGTIDGGGHLDLGIPFHTGTGGSNGLPLVRLSVQDAVLSIQWNGRNIEIPVNATLTQGLKNQIQLDAGVAAAKVPLEVGELRLKNLMMKASIDPGGPSMQVLHASMTADGMALETRDELVGLRGVRAEIPFNASMQREPVENFTVEHVEFRGEQFPGPSGVLSVDGQTLSAKARWTPLEGLSLNAAGQASLKDDGFAAEVKADVATFAIEPIVRMVDADGKLAGAGIAGTCAIDAQFQYASNTLTPLINVSLRDVLVHNPAWTAQVDLAAADLSINSLSPLATTSGQSVKIAKGRFGTLELNDALAEFKVNDRNHIALESLRWSLGDMGRFEASPFELDLTQPVIRTTVSGKAIQLKSWLELFAHEKVRGEGELEGLLFMKIRPTNRFAIELGEGVLEAVPAEGYIQIQDQATIDTLVSRLDFGDDDTLRQVRDRIVVAVQDFKYTMFRVEFTPDDDELVCRIETKGVGRTGQKPQEIGGAVVNIHHFDDILRAVIRGQPLLEHLE